MKHLIITILLIPFIAPAYAGAYINIGIIYLDEAPIRYESRIEGCDCRLVEELSIPVESGSLFIRGGYNYEGLHIEAESVEAGSHDLNAIRLFWGFEFD